MSIASDPASVSEIMPLELVDKCIGSHIWVLLKKNQEFSGVLRGFDQFTNLLLEDVTEMLFLSFFSFSSQILR
ncbi:hypothetical protein RCL1_008586 [Eukaryota sp. TZLM3-RCL]